MHTSQKTLGGGGGRDEDRRRSRSIRFLLREIFNVVITLVFRAESRTGRYLWKPEGSSISVPHTLSTDSFIDLRQHTDSRLGCSSKKKIIVYKLAFDVERKGKNPQPVLGFVNGCIRRGNWEDYSVHGLDYQL